MNGLCGQMLRTLAIFYELLPNFAESKHLQASDSLPPDTEHASQKRHEPDNYTQNFTDLPEGSPYDQITESDARLELPD
jgi:hypothetical protein